MKGYKTRFNLDKKSIEDLQGIVNIFEFEIDKLEHHLHSDKVLLVRERIFKMIDLIANLERDMQIRVQSLIADYYANIYAELAYIEANLEELKTIRQEKGCSLSEEVL